MRPIDPQYYYRRYLHPRHWATWVVIAVLRLMAFLPHKAQQWLGRMIGLASYHLAPDRRQIAATNIRLCFPELTAAEQDQLVKDSLIATAKGYVESTTGWWGNMGPYIERLQIHGLEHLKEAQARGKGVLLLGGHFSILDFAGPLANAAFDFNHMYRPNNDPLFDAMIERNRRRFSGAAFSKKRLKPMMDYLRAGHTVWYGCDQDFGPRYSVFAPFFGIQAATLTTPPWIARETGATVLFISQFREKEDKTYSIYFSPIFENYPSDDEVENATRLNQEIEQMVRRYPEQYLWVHRRFKTRPEGEPSLYPPKAKKGKRKRHKKVKSLT